MKFNWDNVFFQMLGKLVDCVWVSILWFICCIPVVTIGASSTALYYTVHKSVRGNRGYTTRTFFVAFKDNFKQASLSYLVWLVITLVLASDAYVTYQVLKNGSAMGAFFYFFLIMISVSIMWGCYLFSYIARFENTVKQSLKNAILLMIRHLPWSLLLLLIVLLSLFLIYIIPLLLAILPAMDVLFFDFILERLFRRYMSDEDLEREKENDMYAS